MAGLAAVCVGSGVCLHAAPDPMPMAELTAVFPPGVSRSAPATVRVYGRALDELAGMHFSHAGIRAAPKEGAPNTFEVTVAPDVPSGLYEVRVLGRFGLSNPRPFEVSEWREVLASDEHDRWDRAQEIAVGQCVNGQARRRGYDFYRFRLEAGQRVLLQCEAESLDSEMEPVMVLLDDRGRELERNRSSGLLDVESSQAREYVLKVYDALYEGGERHVYRLALHEGPYVEMIVPSAVLPGQTTQVMVYGRLLPGGQRGDRRGPDGRELESLSVAIDAPEGDEFHPPEGMLWSGAPADGALSWFMWRLRSVEGDSNPVRLYRATAPVVVEREPNDDPAQAMAVEPPCEVAGHWFPDRDRDWVEFFAEAGQVWWVEIYSDRMGLPTDPFLLVQRVRKNEQGEEELLDVKELYDENSNLGGREFSMDTRDVRWRFTVAETGLYRIMVENAFGYPYPNPSHGYRLSVRRESPDFQLVAVPQLPLPEDNNDRKRDPWHLFLRRGQTWPVKVMALRQDGFTGSIDLAVAGLPEFIVAQVAPIPAGESAGYVYLTMRGEGEAWSGSVQIVGESQAPGDAEGAATSGMIRRRARYATLVHGVNDFNNEPLQARLCAELTVSALPDEAAPVRLGLDIPGQGGADDEPDKELEVAEGGELQLPVRFVREGEFHQNFKFQLQGHSAFAKVKEWNLIGNATNGVWKISTKDEKIPAGSYSLALVAVTKGKYRQQPEAIEEANVLLEEAKQRVEQAAAFLDQVRGAAQKEAEQSVPQAEKGHEEALQARQRAEEHLKFVTERAKPKDVLLTVFSQPFRVRVVAAPSGVAQDN